MGKSSRGKPTGECYQEKAHLSLKRHAIFKTYVYWKMIILYLKFKFNEVLCFSLFVVNLAMLLQLGTLTHIFVIFVPCHGTTRWRIFKSTCVTFLLGIWLQWWYERSKLHHPTLEELIPRKLAQHLVQSSHSPNPCRWLREWMMLWDFHKITVGGGVCVGNNSYRSQWF